MLQLHLLDVYRAPLGEQVLVIFRNQMTGGVWTARSVSGKALNVRGLDPAPAKCGATVFANGRSVASHLVELRAVSGDRRLTAVSKELSDAVATSVDDGLFDEVSGAFHSPPPGFSSAGSFKTRDRFGNLHVTLFTNSGNWLAEMDIDDANGLAHAFQVLRNGLSGRSTHPYAIHDILMLYQHLDTGYRFEI